MKFKKISFKLKLILFLEVFLIIVNSFLGFLIWKQLSLMIRETSRKKLMSIASTAAIMVDSDAHEAVRTTDDEDGADYVRVQSFLQKVKKANPDVDDIYTMRKGEEENRWNFVVGSKNTADFNQDGTIEPEEERVAVGEEYDASDTPELKKALIRPAADYEINCDHWGCWLSGYAPIRDPKGKTVAVVGVDIPAKDIVDFEEETRYIIAMIVGALIVVFPLLLYPFLSLMVRPIAKIVEGMEKLKHDFSSRIAVDTGDEFELIARTFNNMAGTLEELYNNLEEKVKDKTCELAQKVKEIEEKNIKDEALLASIGEGMIATDKNERMIMINTQGEALLGYQKVALVGKKLSKAIRLEDEKGEALSEAGRPSSIALATGSKAVSSAYYYVRKNGSRFPAMITAAPVIHRDKTIGVVMVFRDITQEKQIDKAKSEFVSLASHQLKTPLVNINWYSEMLLDEDAGKLKPKQKAYLEKVYASSRRMVELVNALLNVSRIEMGTFSIDTRPVRLDEIMAGVIDELMPYVLRGNINIEEKFGKDVTAMMGDEKLLRMVFANLLSNAIKYTPPKGKITIAIQRTDEGKFVVSLSDTGYGIPKHQQNKIFTKLFRADNAKEKVTDGTGLGLYIVKSIVENSGGHIAFESEENNGSSFVVTFPSFGMTRKRGSRRLQ